MYHSNTQIVPDYTNPINFPFCYRMSVTAIGGRAVVGRIPRKVAEYWNEFDRAELAELLIVQDRDVSRTLEGKQIDPDFTTTSWLDVCDEVDLEGPALDWDPQLRVVDEAGHPIFEDDIDSEGLPLNFSVDEPSSLSEDSSYFVGRTGELMTQTFKIRSEKAFEPSLLKLRFSWFLNLRFLNGITYDGRSITEWDGCAHTFDDPVAGIIVNF